MSLKFLSVPDKRLSANLSATGLTFAVNNLTGWDGVTLAAADFGTIHYVVFRDTASTAIEIMQIDPTAITSSSITILKRGLKFEGDQSTEVAANKLFWVKGDTIVSFGTNAPQLYQYLKEYIDGIAIAGSPNASTTAKGISEEATTAEINAGTGAGATGAELFVNPLYLAASIYGLQLPSSGQKDALAGYRGTPSTTNKYLTEISLLTTPADQTQTTQDTTSTVGEADSTTKHNKLAQSFTAATTRIRGVRLYKSADTGSFTGTVTIALQANSAGSPSGSNLASVTVSNATWLALGTGPQDFIFSSEYTSMTSGSLYWIVITTSTSDNSNHPNMGANSVGGYASGSVKYFATADGWTAVVTIDLYFQTLLAQVGTIPAGDTNGKLPAEIMPFTAPVVRFYSANTTWTKPTASNFRFAKVRVQGGGTGGTGVNNAGTGAAGTAGGNTSFGVQVNSNGTGADLYIPGQPGGSGAQSGASGNLSMHAGRGGDAVLGFGANQPSGNLGATANGSVGANYGGGGSGARNSTAPLAVDGGAGGGYAEKLIAASALNATEAVVIGAGGPGGASTGAGGANGGNAAQGCMIVEEYYS